MLDVLITGGDVYDGIEGSLDPALTPVSQYPD